MTTAIADKNVELKKVIRFVEKKSEVTLHRHYSGRFMFGECCVGIVGNRDDCTTVAETIKRKTGKQYRSDNMGLDMIYYFPGISDPRS
jgi:hypothetical protein